METVVTTVSGLMDSMSRPSSARPTALNAGRSQPMSQRPQSAQPTRRPPAAATGSGAASVAAQLPMRLNPVGNCAADFFSDTPMHAAAPSSARIAKLRQEINSRTPLTHVPPPDFNATVAPAEKLADLQHPDAEHLLLGLNLEGLREACELVGFPFRCYKDGKRDLQGGLYKRGRCLEDHVQPQGPPRDGMARRGLPQQRRRPGLPQQRRLGLRLLLRRQDLAQGQRPRKRVDLPGAAGARQQERRPRQRLLLAHAGRAHLGDDRADARGHRGAQGAAAAVDGGSEGARGGAARAPLRARGTDRGGGGRGDIHEASSGAGQPYGLPGRRVASLLLARCAATPAHRLAASRPHP